MKKNKSTADKTADFPKAYRKCLAAAACTAAACFSLMLSPLVNYSAAEGSRWSGVILSVVTWALVLYAAVLAQRVWSFGALRSSGDRGPAGEAYRSGRSGLLRFAANREGLIAEILFGLGVAVWIIRALGLVHWEGPMRMLQYSLTFTGFLLHCFFNGRPYIYIKSKALAQGKGEQ